MLIYNGKRVKKSLDDFLNSSSFDSIQDVEDLRKLYNNGHTLYMATNPFKSEIYNSKVLIWELEADILKTRLQMLYDAI